MRNVYTHKTLQIAYGAKEFFFVKKSQPHDIYRYVKNVKKLAQFIDKLF